MGSIFNTTILFTAIAPIVLIHGYSEDSSVWDSWVSWLKSDGFDNIHQITFSNDDECGSVKSHAAELDKILNNTQVNIVAHSKAGLDTRYYIAHYPDKVANLIMIGTPNRGTPAGYMDLTECAFQGSTGLEDLQPGSTATLVPDSNTTNYYAVAGDYPAPCYIVIERPTCYVIANDGFVTVDSAKSNYTSLGIFHYNHNTLVTQKDVYEKILPILSQ